MPEFHVIDYVFAGVLLIGAIRGAVIGLSRQVFSLVTLAVAVWVAGRYYTLVADQLVSGGHMKPPTADVTAYVVLVLGVWITSLIIRLVIGMVFSAKFKPAFERTGGALIGLITTAILASALIVAAGMTQHEPTREAVTQRSFVGRQLTSLFPSFYEKLSERFELPSLDSIRFSKDAPDDAGPAAPPAPPPEP